MKLKKALAALALGLVMIPTMADAKEKLLFIPIDNRPVCLSYTVDTLKAAGWDIQTPPEEYIASYNRVGDPDKLYKWLEDNALLATDAIISTDSLIYGGLVPSRTHNLAPEVLEARTQRLLNFKKKFDCLRIYAYDTVMRSPHASSAPVEPAYYEKWGPQIFRMGASKDKQEMKQISKKESKELADLVKTIPQDIQTDLYARRNKNVKVTEQLLEGVKNNSFDYFLLGKDDTAVHSDAHRDARHIDSVMKGLPEYKIRFFTGADQLGLILLNRAVNKIHGTTPLVYPFYTEGQGENTIPSFEDTIVKNTLREHILAAGAFPVTKPDRADLILAVNTPVKGTTLSAADPLNDGIMKPATQRFINRIEQYVQKGKNVGVGDIAFSNGSDNALVKGLFEKTEEFRVKMPPRAGIGPVARKIPLSWLLSSYAGWNTSSNTLGYAIGQGLLRPYLTETAKNFLMKTRYLDEWVYEANVRQTVRGDLIYPNKWVDGSLKPEQRAQAEAEVRKNMTAFAGKYFDPNEYGKVEFYLPWSRMFEVDVRKVDK